MAVNLSPFGGVGVQFFDNSGNPLTGGKIFTYTAGTTTPQTTYTTSAGATPHTNPIILDAGGRVPSGGEIWLTDGLQYKFLLKDANDVQIASYDNIVGINSNFVNFTNEQEIQTATAGQTVFTLTTAQYQPGTNSLSVFVDGVNQYGPGAQYAYVETDSTTVTFTNGLHVGAEVKFTTSQLNTSGAIDASQVSYDPPFTNAVITNVEDKLAQTISVTDFGAVGDGVTDDTTAIQNAFAQCGGTDTLFFPPGTYLVTSTPIHITTAIKDVSIEGVPGLSIIKNMAAASNPTILIEKGAYWTIRGLVIIGVATYPNAGIVIKAAGASGNGADRCLFGLIDQVTLCPNGVGIDLQDSNTIEISQVKYFPSGNFYGATFDANARTNAILANNVGAVNEIHIHDCIFQYTEAVSGTNAAIAWNTTDPSNCIHIHDCELEQDSTIAPHSTKRSIYLQNVFGDIQIYGNYLDNSQMLLLKCRYIDIGNNQYSGTNAVKFGDGTVGNACSYLKMTGGNVYSVTDDANCDHMNYENINSVIAWAASNGTYTTEIGCLDGVTGARTDVINFIPKTPSFVAGDYTASAGNWTVDAGDVITMRYSIVGKLMTLEFNLNNTTVSATPIVLLMKCPGSKTPANSAASPSIIYSEDGGTNWATGVVRTIAGNANVSFYKDYSGATWQTKTNLTCLTGRLTFEIQ